MLISSMNTAPSSNQPRPHLLYFSSLPHSQNPYAASPAFSITCTLFEKQGGVYPQKRSSSETQRSLRIKSPINRVFSLPAAPLFSQSRHPLPGITTTYFYRTTTEAPLYVRS